jgi:hypothetical protein
MHLRCSNGCAATNNVGLIMSNTWMQENLASLDGAAMHIESTITLSDLVNITMIGNQAQSFGGAINEASSNITLSGSTVVNNVAGLYAGGLFSFFAGMYIFNSNIIGNR